MKRFLKSIGILTTIIIIIAALYLAYVLIGYQRIEDNQHLEVNNISSEIITTGTPYAITTFNIGYGSYSPDYSFFMDGGEYSRAFSEEDVIQNVNGAAAIIAEMDPDFAFFQEVDTDSTRSYHVEEYQLLRECFPYYSSVFANNYDSPYLYYPINSPVGKSVSGIVTLSKYNIESSLRRSLPLESGLRKLLDLDRCYSITRIPVANGKTLCLINLHLSAFTADVTIGEAQLKMLFEDAKNEYGKGNYVIIGGDFNKISWATPLKSSVQPVNYLIGPNLSIRN